MNELELDTRLQQLAAKQVTVPDFRQAVRNEIARKSGAVERVANLPFSRYVPSLILPALLAAILLGISVPFAMRAVQPDNQQAQAARALHLDIFTAAAIPGPTINLTRLER